MSYPAPAVLTTLLTVPFVSRSCGSALMPPPRARPRSMGTPVQQPPVVPQIVATFPASRRKLEVGVSTLCTNHSAQYTVHSSGVLLTDEFLLLPSRVSRKY